MPLACHSCHLESPYQLSCSSRLVMANFASWLETHYQVSAKGASMHDSQ